MSNKQLLRQKVLDKIHRLSPTAPFSNPTTSKAASSALEGFLSNRRYEIWDHIAEHGPISDHQVAIHLKLDRSSVSPRRLELWMAGLVKDSGHTAKTPGGQEAIQWEINLEFDPTKIIQATKEIRASGKTQRVLIGEIEAVKDAVEIKLPGGTKFIVAPKIFDAMVLHLQDATNDSLIALFNGLASHRELDAPDADTEEDFFDLLD